MTKWTMGLTAAFLAAGVALPGHALAKKPKGLIKASANGKFKANLVKTVTYTAANTQFVVAATHKKGATIRTINIMCLGVQLTAGTTYSANCGGGFTNLAPLKGINQLWTFDSVTVTIDSYNGKVLKAHFDASGPGNSSTANAPITVTGGVIKAPVIAD